MIELSAVLTGDQDIGEGQTETVIPTSEFDLNISEPRAITVLWDSSIVIKGALKDPLIYR